MQLFEHVKSILSQNESFCKDGKIFKNNVVEAALKLSPELLSILLKDETTQKHFFTAVEGVQVFDKIKFQQFVSNKQFLPDSYTAFKNKIGLTANGEYLTEANEVVLDFPYKDCVLEGGQTKEDQKRKEIFWNETLAGDEIDRLFEPKVLTNWKKYNKDGENKLEDFSNNENLIIKGNNLLAMHSLLNKYMNSVKLIYIDPPYNTGNDGFNYNDSFNHSTWLTFMKNRFQIAKKLLRTDGFLVVQCDDNEQAYLKVLMDNVLKMHFVTTICVQMSYVSGEKMAHIDKKPPKIKEFLHIYAKTQGTPLNPQYTYKDVDFEYNKYIKRNNSDNPEDWEVVNINQIFKAQKINDEEQKEEFMLDNASDIFNRVRNKSETFKNTLGNKKLQIVKTPTGLEKWAWNGREVVFLSDRIIEDHEGNQTYSQALGDIWTDIPIVNLYLEGDVTLLKGKKPEFLIYRIVEMLTNQNDLVLDYHLGSGTTAAVCHKNGRKYIGIEQLDYGENDSVVRLNNVINGDLTGISPNVNWKGGGSFVYAELAENAASYLNKIKAIEKPEEAITLWNQLKQESFISYRVSPTEFDKNINTFEELELDDQKKLLIAIIDKNHLYINYADMDDATYNISEADKELNNQFYNS